MDIYDLIFDKDDSIEINKVLDCYFFENENTPIRYLPNSNHINIIIGSNNSGKSRFMRQLMSYESFEGVKNIVNVENLILEYNIQVNKINLLISDRIKGYDYRSKNNYFSDGTNIDEKYSNLLRSNLLIQVEDFYNFSLKIQGNKDKISNIKSLHIKNDFLYNYPKLDKIFYRKFDNIKRYYIPTLRTAHSLFKFEGTNDYKKIDNDIFKDTLNNYYKLDKINVEVFTGINLYKEILLTRNSEKSVRKGFEQFEQFLKINFFDNKQIDIVAKYVDKNNAKIEDEELILIYVEGENVTRKLFDLGDGIQAIIVLMYKIFTAEPDSFIFIDEPELNLHPGMQRLFLEQISSNIDLKKKNLKYFISTHSNHFLDLTIEKDNVSIYSFSPKTADDGEKQFIIKNVNSGDNQILKNLGVNNSSVFMANCSIWVEGISDRNYIKAFLKSYSYHLKNDKKNYVNLKEDIDFAFFEYAGSNIDHYIFDKELEKEDEKIILKDINSLALNNRIFLLADSDSVKMTEKKGKRLRALEEIKSLNFFPKIIWEAREIENLLTNNIWKEILIELCNKSLVEKFGSHIQILIDEALLIINSKNYSKKYIGEFINDIRTKVDKSSKTFYINQSNYEVKSDGSFGTIINKRELSEIVFNKNFSWEILKENKEIEKLTIEIYNFILDK